MLGNDKTLTHNLTQALIVLFLFAVPASLAHAAVPLSVPASITAEPGETIQIPVSAANTTGVIGYYFELTFDAAILDYVGLAKGSLTGGWDLPTGNSQAGRISVAGYGSNSLSGSGTLAVVTLQVKTGAAVGSQSAIHFSAAELNDGAVPVTTSDGQVLVRAVAALSAPTGLVCDLDSEIDVPITLTSASSVFGYYFDLSFDPAIAQFVSVTKGPLVPAWDPPVFNSGVAGHIQVASYNPDSVSGTGVLVTVRIRILAGATRAATSFLRFVGAEINDGGLPLSTSDGYVTVAPDSDGDGLSDMLEVAIGTNPTLVDTDGDGVNDFAEYVNSGAATAKNASSRPSMSLVYVDFGQSGPKAGSSNFPVKTLAEAKLMLTSGGVIRLVAASGVRQSTEKLRIAQAMRIQNTSGAAIRIGVRATKALATAPTDAIATSLSAATSAFSAPASSAPATATTSSGKTLRVILDALRSCFSGTMADSQVQASPIYVPTLPSAESGRRAANDSVLALRLRATEPINLATLKVQLPKGAEGKVTVSTQWAVPETRSSFLFEGTPRADSPFEGGQRGMFLYDGSRSLSPFEGTPRADSPFEGTPRADSPFEGTPRADSPFEGGQRGMLSAAPETQTDLWVLLQPINTWPLGEFITWSAEAKTVSGSTAGPVSHTFIIENEVQYLARAETPPTALKQPRYGVDVDASAFDLASEAQDEVAVIPLEAEAAAQALQEAGIGTDVGTTAYRIGPETAYAKPQRIWLPVPDGFQAETLRLYGYATQGPRTGWFPAEAIEGFLVSEPPLVLPLEGRTYLGYLVRHGGLVILSPPRG